MSVLGRVVIYAKDIEAMVVFYTQTFGFEVLRDPADRIVELRHPEGGAVINLHPAAKSQKMGQVLVKLVFDVQDVEAFVAQHSGFGSIHRVSGYQVTTCPFPAAPSKTAETKKG